MNLSLIEDEPDCFENYEILLKSRGHHVTTYTDADDVVKSIDEVVKSDLIILDLMIQLGSLISPDEGSETGIAIYRRIRKAARSVRILIVTARSKSEVWADFSSDACVHFLAKPVRDLDFFCSAIEEWRQ